MLTLYRAPYSTNVQRVTLALAHKRVAVDEEVVISYDDRSAVEAVSGQGLVPVVVLDGDVIADSMTIVAELDRRYPDPPLYPRDPARRAEVDVFVDWFNRVWKVEPNAIEAGGDMAAPAATMDARLDLFEAMLDGREYLMGDALSAADVCTFPFLKYAAQRDPADDEAFHVILDEHQSVEGRPRLAAWIERLRPLAERAGA